MNSSLIEKRPRLPTIQSFNIPENHPDNEPFTRKQLMSIELNISSIRESVERAIK